MNGEVKKTIRLSERLRTVAELVTPGNTVADVGCDHGFVSIYLVQAGISPHVLATDVREGPLAAAREHIRACGLEDRIETRLSDGLSALRLGEAQTLICAGMGGALMQRILTAEPEKTASFAELILQPQSELAAFRVFLRTHGLVTRQERILCEDGKYYFAFRATPGGIPDAQPEQMRTNRMQRLYDSFGEQLLEERNAILREYLRKRLKQAESVGETLRQWETVLGERALRRQAENREETALLREALAYIGEGA